MNYRENHLRILNVLADELPKRVTFTVKELALKFKNTADADRAARNALRKPVSEGHVEASDRGTYRLTSEGANFMRKVQKDGYKVTAEVTQKTRKKVFTPTKKRKASKEAQPKATGKIKLKGIKKKVKAEAAPPKTRQPRAKKVESVVVNSAPVVAPAPQAHDSEATLGI